jgi:6-phospho-3-hexuloisomerase
VSVRELEAIGEELAGVLRDVDPERLDALQAEVQSAARVYVAGAGRSGLVMCAFGMRLMHLGLAVHVVGQVTTPAFARGDLLVVGSGSGETGSSCMLARKARALGGRVGLVTFAPGSTLGQLADVVLPIDAPSPSAALEPGRPPRASVQLLGSLFDQALLVTLDALALRLARGRGERADALLARHANLE